MNTNKEITDFILDDLSKYTEELTDKDYLFEFDVFATNVLGNYLSNYDGWGDLVINGKALTLTSTDCAARCIVFSLSGDYYLYIPFEKIKNIFAGNHIQVCWYNK
jgi:hypothetical protein